MPNRNITLITPKRLFQQRAKSQRVSSIFTTFGMTVNDELVSSDLGDLPHLLIVGDDLSGKTMLLHAILMELLCTQTPETLKFLLISTKSTELNVYADIPHLLGPVITDPFIVNSALLRCIKEMEYRYELLRSAGARDLWRYNEQKRQNSEEIVPVMVLIFDDISEILDSMGGQIKANLLKLMEKSNTVGIHVVATVRMLPKTGISEQLKSKFASRIALKLKSRTASESIVNIAGAEELMGNGDMLFLKRYSSVPIRLQGCFVSKKEKSKLIKFWKNQNSNRRKTESITSTITETKNEVEIDPLFVKAISIAKEKNYVSISFLQRELRIGYNRASRIVTMMEQQGIIESNKIERSKNVKHSSNPIE